MDPLIQLTLQGLATHHKVEVDHLIGLLLSKEALILQSLTDFTRPGSFQELQRTLDQRDPKLAELCQLLLTRIADLDRQKAAAQTLLAELQRMRAFLQRRYPEVIPANG